MKRNLIFISILAFLICLSFLWYEGSRVLLKENVILEYGSEPSTDPSTYFQLGFLKKDYKVDVSHIDTHQVGSHPVYLEDTDKKVMVEVKDTIKPTIKLKHQIFEIVEGETLQAKDIIKEINDLSGIQSVVLEDANIPEDQIILDENNIPNYK